MQIPRFFLYGKDLQSLSQSLSTEPGLNCKLSLVEEDLIKQIKSVLRLGKGDLLKVLDNQGNLVDLIIESVNPKEVITSIQKIASETKNSLCSIEIAQSLIKGERFEWCLEKLTELGANNIVPLSTERGVVKLEQSTSTDGADRLANKMRRWQSIIREAAEQSERVRIPHLLSPQNFEAYTTRPTGDGIKNQRFICSERDRRQTLKNLLERKISTRQIMDISLIENISVLIGPEGGFTDKEISLAIEHGWEPVSLGPRILRSETAAISALAQIASILEV